jgi:hypothetical protein
MDELTALGEVTGEVAGDARNVKTTIPGDAAGEVRGEAAAHGSTAIGDMSGDAPDEAAGDVRDVKRNSGGDVGGDVNGAFATLFLPPPATVNSPAGGGNLGRLAPVGMSCWYGSNRCIIPMCRPWDRGAHPAGADLSERVQPAGRCIIALSNPRRGQTRGHGRKRPHVQPRGWTALMFNP